MSISSWVQYLRLGSYPRCENRTTKNKKIVKSVLLAKQQYTLRGEAGSSETEESSEDNKEHK
jgi:hypothetical protein